MSIDMQQFNAVFFEEVSEHLTNMESLLLDIDVDSPNLEDLNAIFRAAHSIKGGAGIFGFDDMTEVTHILETLLDKLRKEELLLTTEMIDAFLQAGDILAEQKAVHQEGGDTVDESKIKAVCLLLETLSADKITPTTTPETTTFSPHQADKNISFLTSMEEDITALLEELSQLGHLTQSMIVEGEFHKWQIFLTKTSASNEDLIDSISFLAEPESILIEDVITDPAQCFGLFEEADSQETDFGFFDEPDSEEQQGFGLFDDVEEKPVQTKESAFGLFSDEKITPKAVENTKEQDNDPRPYGFLDGREEKEVKNKKTLTVKRTANKASSTGETSIRVNTEKVDQLINQVGELVITQAMLMQISSELDPSEHDVLLNRLTQLERNTRDLQESVMSIRMMPISFVFGRFPRVVRDLSNKLNKKIELKMIGNETELDKGLVEKLADPLTHLIRNSIDHGIEMPEDRIANGKPETGTITLFAFYEGGNVVISISDDGAGLNREKIIEKALERGMELSDTISDSEVYQLIFSAGFSTAEKVTDVSGRGVGMDVVKRNIHSMGGQVDIHSEAGVGSTISIRLPLTLAILDGMSISVAGQIYIIPLTFISESLQPKAEDIKTINGKGKVVKVRGDYIPLLALHELFNIDTEVTQASDGILVLLENNNKKIALLVDQLEGQQQVVLKSLETNFHTVPCISGATIMGDGKVALILDIAGLVSESE
ncbi:chemotaxis protein CheW [Psychromonas hadalis]|uniref:chemotaxis protein CheW n=1 Tax=Psychromonas hadalis TaxID=211669 RepID=UPI0003B625B3|nr:chemotaxis protein CheW [Psychromonas hadalis]